MTEAIDPPFDWSDFEVPVHARGGRVTLHLYDELSRFLPKRPGAYLRISSDRFGLEAGVERQQQDTEDTRHRLGWGPFAKIYKENDTSAFKKRKITRADGSVDWVVVRPEFRRLLADLTSGVIDGVIFYDLDRLVRQPRDLEDLIDIVEHTQRPVVGATGGRMNLINDSDRHMARMMCVMALKSSEDTARRVARMHLATAQEGKIQGRIAYGWIRKGPEKGRIIEDEAKVVVDIFKDCLAGETAYAIAIELNRRGVKPPAAEHWSSVMVNKMLRNPRYAGLVSYAGKHRVDATTAWDGWSRVLFDDDGRPLVGSWSAIVSPKMWSQVQFELQLRRAKQGLPAGTHRPAVTVKYELSGILTCGHCTRGLVGHRTNQRKNRYYRCPSPAIGGCGKTNIPAIPAEEAMAEGMTAFLKQLMAVPLTAPIPSPRAAAALRTELQDASTRKQDLLSRWTKGTLQELGYSDQDFYELATSIASRISHLREQISLLEKKPAHRSMADEDIESWQQGTLRQRRAIYKRYLHGVHVAPAENTTNRDQEAIVRDRLKPRWKTAEEIAA